MEARLKRWSIIGVPIAYTLAGGWHFLYNALPYGIIGVISPVNESPWEHAKLFFIPVLLWYAALYLIVGRHFPNFIFAHGMALLFMPVLMLLLYYSYQSFFEETLPLDLVNAFVTIAAGALLAYRLTLSKKDFSALPYRIAALVVVLALLAVYAVFTFWPPHCGMFWDPSAQRYGMPPD